MTAHTDIDIDAWCLMVAVPHRGRASARIDLGRRWVDAYCRVEWLPADDEPVMLEHLREWALDDMQAGAFVLVPMHAPCERSDAEAILAQLPVQAMSAAERELANFWGDDAMDFDDLYADEEDE